MGHMTRWLFFNLMFGAIPYTLVVALNQLQSPGSPLLHPSSEVLFIAVVATSSALGELWDDDPHLLTPRSHWRVRWQLLMLLGVLSSSLLYGAYVYATLGSPGRVHGLDCSVVTRWSVTPSLETWQVAAVDHWRGPCATWMKSQEMFFRSSLWMTTAWAVLGTAAMYSNPPRKW